MVVNDSQRVQHIGIIGAGPAGLAAVKAILDTPQYKAGRWIPTAFEARPNVGGVWLPSDLPAAGDTPPPTPLYDSLTTNLPHPVMAFSSFSFPPSTPLFPKAEVVQTYLESYADVFGLRKHILFNRKVVNADWALEGYWVVQTQPEREGGSADGIGDEETEKDEWHFDLLLVCNGHYNDPRYPSIPGLSTWRAAGRASHSKFYRNPSSIPRDPSSSSASSNSERALNCSSPTPDGPNKYPHLKNQTILVIGAGPSGSDITTELVPLAARVFHSFTPHSFAAREAGCATDTDTNADTTNLDAPFPSSSTTTPSAILKPRVSSFSSPENLGGVVYFEDGSVERGVDFCVLATGYNVAFPFFGATTTSSLPTSSLDSCPLDPTQHVNTDSLLRPSPDFNLDRNPNFTLCNGLIPSHTLPSHIDTHLRNTSWSVFPLARHLFGLPGCGFSHSATSSTSSSNADPKPTLTSSPTTVPSPASLPSPSTPTLPPPTSLAFLGLLVRVVPLPQVELQAKAALAAFASGSGNGSHIDWTLEEEGVLQRWEELSKRWDAGGGQLGLEGPVGSGDADGTEKGEEGKEREKEMHRRTFISREWQRFTVEGKQFDYRDALDDFVFALQSQAHITELESSASAENANTHSDTNLNADVDEPERNKVPTRVRVKPWERKFEAEKITLRKAWQELERRGWAEDWVRGVGEGQEGKTGEEEWVAFMERVLEFGRTLAPPVYAGHAI